MLKLDNSQQYCLISKVWQWFLKFPTLMPRYLLLFFFPMCTFILWSFPNLSWSKDLSPPVLFLSFFTVYVQFLNCMIFIHCLSFTQYWTLVLIRMHFFLTRSSQGLYWVFHKGTISLQYLKAQKFLLELTADNVCQVFLKINAHFRKYFQAFHS